MNTESILAILDESISAIEEDADNRILGRIFLRSGAIFRFGGDKRTIRVDDVWNYIEIEDSNTPISGMYAVDSCRDTTAVEDVRCRDKILIPFDSIEYICCSYM